MDFYRIGVPRIHRRLVRIALCIRCRGPRVFYGPCRLPVQQRPSLLKRNERPARPSVQKHGLSHHVEHLGAILVDIVQFPHVHPLLSGCDGADGNVRIDTPVQGDHTAGDPLQGEAYGHVRIIDRDHEVKGIRRARFASGKTVAEKMMSSLVSFLMMAPVSVPMPPSFRWP